MEKISEHISYEEATQSDSAIRHNILNAPNEIELNNMKVVAVACFEPMRKWYGKPLKVSSFFRCDALNKAVKGSKTSQHVQGKAIDIDTGDRDENKKLFDYAKANLIFDQLIAEGVHDDGYDWVHISFDLGANRNQSMYAHFDSGKVVYLNSI